jgi:hypothetical protein
MEAGMLQEELLKKHPELAKLREPLVPPATPQISLTNQPARVTATNRPVVMTSMVSRAGTNLKTMVGRIGLGQTRRCQLSSRPCRPRVLRHRHRAGPSRCGANARQVNAFRRFPSHDV